MRTRGAIAVLAWLWPCAAWAQDAPEQASDKAPAFSVLFENDLFYKTDHDYTNGTELSYTTTPDKDDLAVATARLLPFITTSGDVRTRYALGQAMFTPDDITLKVPLASDRPYAAFSFVSAGVVGDDGHHFDQAQLSLGVIGPMAGGQEIQKFIHAIVHARKPTGWHYQLRDEPGLAIQYERTWLEPEQVLGLDADLEPHVGGAVGNVWDYVNAGIMGRIGFHLPRDYGPMRIAPSLPGSDYFETKYDIGAYAFAGVEGRAIERNLFLDGNSFESSPSVSKRNMVGDLVVGAAVIFQHARLAFSHVIRTREYKTQHGDDQFGAIDLTIRY